MPDPQQPQPQPDPVTAAGMTIGRAIANERVRRRITQVEFASRCGFSVRTLSKIESGDVSIGSRSLLTAAHHLGGLDDVVTAVVPAREGGPQ